VVTVAGPEVDALAAGVEPSRTHSGIGRTGAGERSLPGQACGQDDAVAHSQIGDGIKGRCRLADQRRIAGCDGTGGAQGQKLKGIGAAATRHGGHATATDQGVVARATHQCGAAVGIGVEGEVARANDLHGIDTGQLRPVGRGQRALVTLQLQCVHGHVCPGSPASGGRAVIGSAHKIVVPVP